MHLGENGIEDFDLNNTWKEINQSKTLQYKILPALTFCYYHTLRLLLNILNIKKLI